ncbi:hypothetical protein HGA88_06120 [Candidatus Roizmanbacteria bacterium]|nr:hypothetical protein [Candidatus Roizmanbacteria bacterium]
MKGFITAISIAFFVFCFVHVSVQAASLQLTHIGTLDTGGKTYTHWWYSGTQPTFGGTADPNSQLSVTLDADTKTVSADGQGNWSYTAPTPLSSADHQVKFTSGGQTVSFTLTIGSSMPQNAGSNTNQLPTAGNALPLVGVFSAALLFIFMGFKLKGSESAYLVQPSSVQEPQAALT